MGKFGVGEAGEGRRRAGASFRQLAAVTGLGRKPVAAIVSTDARLPD